MKKTLQIIFSYALIIGLISCNTRADETTGSDSSAAAASETGQSAVVDNVSNPNVVQVAAGSKDHSTLVAAVKAAGLVDALSNAGPFTVFAPTNAAFDKLPAGTVKGLLEPEKKDALTDILQYHVYVGVLKAESLTDGQKLGQVNGKSVTVTVKDGKVLLNGKAAIIASIPASNGIIHVIDEVLLPE